MQKKEIIVVGGGIVGLASARALQKKKPHLRIALLEKEEALAQHQTGRNSGVVHSGVYYQPGSLKAETCFAGRRMLLSFCEEKGIPIERYSKVIVATEERELPLLAEVERRGRANRVEGLQRIGKEQLKEIEPHATGLEALWIPNCPIVSYAKVAEELGKEILADGGEILFGQKVRKIREGADHCIVETEKEEYQASFVVSCAGLFSDRLCQKKIASKIIPFRGEYYELVPEKRHLVKGLIYPVADPKLPFLGVHLTRMMGGRVEAGPNAVMALAREGYRKSHLNLRDLWETLSFPGFWKMAYQHAGTGVYEYYRSLYKGAFVRDLQKLVPEIQAKDLEVGMRGIRAQMVGGNGALLTDFLYQREGRTIHVLNAPSPAATASFSIAEKIVEAVQF